ncbi:hypothetical protein GW662_22835 [Escherichia coli]|uniref:MobV family relaxase n=2 Tax=Escherichia coli TaxID=562 RepID=UPI00164F9DF8|nr:MobV family relaxase [Escherichia coli]MBC6514004.1 hypothetical protein [Escherichia coli]
MAYAILRAEKLKTFGNIGGSLSHNYRTRETPNADAERTHLNTHSQPTAAAARSAIEARLPEKRRSDAVLCVEYFIGASPEYFAQSGDKDGSRYFATALEWLKERHGAENVVATSVHHDETSPHLVAYVVPIDQDTGKLNAKKFLGGKATLSRMQSDFAEKVRHHGLERGIEGSKATHTRVQDWYAQINKEEPKLTNSLDLPKKKTFESHESYDNRVRDALREQLKPKIDVLEAKAQQLEQAKKEAREAREGLKQLQSDLKPLVDVLRPLDQADRQKLADILKVESAKLVAEKERQKAEQEAVKKAENERKKAEKVAAIKRKRTLSSARTLSGKDRGGQGR